MRQILLFRVLPVVACLLLIGALWVFRAKLVLPNKFPAKNTLTDVSVPTIINGELVLPKIATAGGGVADPNLGRQPKVGVISASLVPVMENDKLVALRILGEMTNLGDQVITGISPVVRFFDSDGKTIAQKVGRPSDTWNFFGLAGNEKSLYDVIVENPPTADKLEIVLNAATASDSAVFDQLKIASRSMEIKTASSSAGEKIEYYAVTGQVVNTLSDLVSDIAIYAWVRDKENKVYSFARQDFKNDLLAVWEKIDFKITLLPFKINQTYDFYELAAWGKRYRLNL